MEPPDPSFADEFNVSQEYAVLVFNVRRAVVSLPFLGRRFKAFVEAGVIAFPNACFEFVDEGPDERKPCEPSKGFCQPSSRPFEGCCCKVLRAGPSLPLSLLAYWVDLSLRTRTRGPTLCSARAFRVRCQFDRAVESMTSAISVAMSLMQVMSGICGSAATIAFATWHRKFGSAIEHLRSTVFGVSLIPLSLIDRFDEDLRGMRAFAYKIL